MSMSIHRMDRRQGPVRKENGKRMHMSNGVTLLYGRD